MYQSNDGCRNGFWKSSNSEKSRLSFDNNLYNLSLFQGTGWARDGWLTSMMWHPEIDFMIHGWKSNQLKPTPNTPLK